MFDECQLGITAIPYCSVICMLRTGLIDSRSVYLLYTGLLQETG